MNNIKNVLRKNKVWFVVLLINWLLLSLVSGYTLYSISLLSGIENMIRLIIAVIIILVWILNIFLSFKSLRKIRIKNRRISTITITKRIVFIIISIIYALGLFFVANNIERVIKKVGNVSTDSTTYSSSLIALKDNKANDIKDIGKNKIGILIDESSYEGYVIPKEIIKKEKLKNEVSQYDDFVPMIQDLYDGNIDYIFVPTNYSLLFNGIKGLEHLKTDTKIIYTKTKSVKNTIKSPTKKLTEPFTILLMGVDSELEDIKGASFNGDSLMLITFNPNTLNSTIMSVPRDSYVPISCFTGERKNKITHAAWYGEECMINTISNFTGIKIDYYVKINFKGVVNLVDTLGGVDVDVPYSFCEQNSNREWGDNTVYVEEGYQTLSGEQALALARNRHPNPDMCSSKWTDYNSNDFVRGQHQQTIVKAMLNKIKDIRSLDTVYKLLDTISNSMETNMSQSNILSLYDIAKKGLSKASSSSVEDVLGMQRLYISGYDWYIYDYNPQNGQGTQMTLYNFVPYKGSLKDVINAMKLNLGQIEPEVIKEFEFTVDEPYEETVIGKGYYDEEKTPLMEDLTDMNESQARSWCNRNGISLKVQYVDATASYQYAGQVISQNIPLDTDLDYVSSVTIKVISNTYKEPVTEEPTDEPTDEPTEDLE